MVVEQPPKGLGTINDMWFQWVIDIGFPGPDRGEAAVDFAKGRQRIVERCVGHRDLLEHLELRLEPLDLVVQERVLFAILSTRRAAHAKR